MKLVLKILGLALLALLMLVGALMGKAEWERGKFIRETAGIFGQVRGPDDLAKVDQALRPDLILVIKFPDGSWAMVRALDEEETEYGFTAAMLYTPSGLWLSRYGFCGYEGLQSEMGSIKAASAAEYVSLVTPKFGFKPYSLAGR